MKGLLKHLRTSNSDFDVVVTGWCTCKIQVMQKESIRSWGRLWDTTNGSPTCMFRAGVHTHTQNYHNREFPKLRRAVKSTCMHRSNFAVWCVAREYTCWKSSRLHSHWNSHSCGIHRSKLAVCCAMRHNLRFCVRCKLAQNTIHRITTRRQRCNSACWRASSQSSMRMRLSVTTGTNVKAISENAPVNPPLI